MKEPIYITVNDKGVRLSEDEIEFQDIYDVFMKLTPGDLLYIIQEYQKHFKIRVTANVEGWRGIIGTLDLGMTDPNHWFMKDEEDKE